MLTYPSDSLPQVVCPMDEDAIPPNPFCSAPPHSEPQPPLLPLSSVTPSCEHDGISGIRRSGRIQGVRDRTPRKQIHKDSRAAHRPSRQNPSPAKRERVSSMVQVSQSLSVKLRRDDKHAQDIQNKDELDFEDASECPTKHVDRSNENTNASATKTVDEETAGNTAQDNDASQLNLPKSDMDTCGDLAVENASAMKSWVIGPLFQSFKSKMASFTEIVMSPVKLFKANSPPHFKDHPDKLNQEELQATAASSGEHSDPSENRNEDSEADQRSSSSPICFSDAGGGGDLKTVALLHSENLLSDVGLSAHSSQQVDECALPEKETNTNDSVPLQHSSLPFSDFEKTSESYKSDLRSSSARFQPSDNSSALQESKLKMSAKMEEQKRKRAAQPKPLPRKRAGNKSALHKSSPDIFPSEVKEEVSDPGTNGIHSIETNISNPCDNGKSQSSSPSVYYTPPDTEVCLPHGDDDDRKRDIGSVVRKSLRNNSRGVGVNDSTLKSPLDVQLVQKQQLECKLKTESVESSAASLGKAKRRLKLASPSDIEPDLVKRKRLADKHKKDPKSRSVAADSDIFKESKPPRNEAVSTNTVLDMEIVLNPARTRLLLSAGMKRKGKDGHTETENPSGTVLVCSLDKSNGISENNQKDNVKSRASGSKKRLKKSASVRVSEPDMNTDSMDLETTVTTEVQEPLLKDLVEPLAAKLCRPQFVSRAQPKSVRKKKDVSPALSMEPSQSPSELMNLCRGPLKRKSQKQESSTSEPCSTLVSTSSAEFTPTDWNSSELLHKEESLKTGLRQLSKRLKKDCVRSVKSNESNDSQLTKTSMDNFDDTVTEGQSKDKITGESLPFEMSSAENNQQASPSPPYSDCFVSLNTYETKRDRVRTRNSRKKRSTGSLSNEEFPTDLDATKPSQDMTVDEIKDLDKDESCTYRLSMSALELKHSARRVKKRRIDNQRRKCRVLHSKIHAAEVEMSSVTSEDVDLFRTGSSDIGSSSRCLLRSYSCPEIPSLLHQETQLNSSLHSPQHGRIHTSHQHQSCHIPPIPQAPVSPRRTRRHTVCSVEVEREIAPLCLRKEVYPSRRSAPYGSITQHLPTSVPLSPSSSLSALASCFLSSPLAFLSKKLENRGAATGSSSYGQVSSPSSSSVFTSSSPSSSSARHLPGFLTRTDSSAATGSSICSVIPLDCEIETRKQIEEDEDGEDTSCSSQEFEDVALREEKALSDSEIKVVQKHEERGKVSSIRIRKALPKPQNNLTPMGLPKPIRLKKKEFSLEEIYTNKNFTKPPESRLETVFETPLSRRNGSQCLFGQRRVKRFVEFPEVGVARKPKKPLVGSGKAGASTSRPRRGGYSNPKDEPSISVQELDSLLCAKLDQLDLWLSFDQSDS
ncbi:uncharacterized protein prr14 isoform X2 [Myripristis murdjan]|nr:uncharacterized protein LOC115363785 isoform X2 [Myripristis murdjan]